MPQLRQELLNRLKTDDDLVYVISKGTRKKFATVRKWVEGKDPDEMLTSRAVVLIIKEETGLTEDEILEKETAAASAL